MDVTEHESAWIIFARLVDINANRTPNPSTLIEPRMLSCVGDRLTHSLLGNVIVDVLDYFGIADLLTVFTLA